MTENELILTSLLDCRRIDLYVDQKPLTPQHAIRFSEILARRRNGEPLQYLIGHCEFMGLRFNVDKRVLIPRPETELLTQAVIDYAKSLKDKSLNILDIGTGSGNIAIALAKNISGCHMTAVDISKEALNVAEVNAKSHSVSNKIKFIKGDVFHDWQKDSGGKKLFDIIVSNQPYIVSDEINHLPCDVQREPRVALDGGSDGLYFYRRIIEEAPVFLKAGGFLFLEMGDGQKEGVESIFFKDRQFTIKNFIKDYAGINRIIITEHKTDG